MDSGSLGKLVDAMLLSARKQGARRIEVTRGGVRFLVEDAWHDEMTPPDPLCDHVIRRLAVMMGVLAPGRGQTVLGTVTLSIGEEIASFRVELVRDVATGLGATVEPLAS